MKREKASKTANQGKNRAGPNQSRQKNWSSVSDNTRDYVRNLLVTSVRYALAKTKQPNATAVHLTLDRAINLFSHCMEKAKVPKPLLSNYSTMERDEMILEEQLSKYRAELQGLDGGIRHAERVLEEAEQGQESPEFSSDEMENQHEPEELDHEDTDAEENMFYYGQLQNVVIQVTEEMSKEL